MRDIASPPVQAAMEEAAEEQKRALAAAEAQFERRISVKIVSMGEETTQKVKAAVRAANEKVCVGSVGARNPWMRLSAYLCASVSLCNCESVCG